MQPIIHAEELEKIIDNENLIIVDAGSGDLARDRYNNEHIKGALYTDLNIHLAEIPLDAKNGGRHPLPSPEKFAQVLGALGISQDSHIIAYDDKQGSNAAARFWWMLRAAGHDKVQVLNGGLQSAKAVGIAVTNAVTIAKEVPPYPFTDWQLPLRTLAEVQQATVNNKYLIIDVRDSERYLGITEPLDPVAGHIPNAVNMPFKNHLNTQGGFLDTTELRLLYAPYFKKYDAENIIVHCGSGVTACHTLLAFAQAGFKIPALYAGSWSEWCRNS